MIKKKSSWKKGIFGCILAVVLCGSGCAALKEAFLGPDPVASPADDVELWSCRLAAEADLNTSHDAGGACHVYDNCVIDSGMRGDIGYCNGVHASDAGGTHD